MIFGAPNPRSRQRRGITLTEILIAIMILGIGLVSIATLFPIGLLRMRDATRFSRTKYLVDAAGPDGTARTLFSANSFALVDGINFQYGLPPWYYTIAPNGGGPYNPLIQDTPSYGEDVTQNGVTLGANSGNSGSYGLPFAYDPLWRYQTLNPVTGISGYYLGDGYANPGVIFEARFGSGIGFLRAESDGFSQFPSAHGLQRITNFNRTFNPANGLPVMPISSVVPSIFVSPEDVVWVQDVASNGFSPVLPDLSLNYSINAANIAPVPMNAVPALPAPAIDWHYSWMFTGYQVSSSGGSTFEGNIVIFENRPFGIDASAGVNGFPQIPGGTYQVEGETVVEAIFGHSGNMQGGYGAGADRTVLLRWSSTLADPIVRPGDWICDVTYERNALVVYNSQTGSGRFLNGSPPIGVPNLFNKGEWDNLPAQRAFWYQVQKVIPAIDDPYIANNPPLRSMVVYVDRTLQARTLLSGQPGVPVYQNAALISPYVVNVIPQQFTVK